MGDLVLPPIKWIGMFLDEDGLEIRFLRPHEKISYRHVCHFCRYAINGPVKVQLELYKALRRQHGDRMDSAAIEYLDAEIAALEEMVNGPKKERG